jgi:amino acid permease
MTLMKTWIGFISSKIQPSVKIKWLKLRRMITLGVLVMPVGFVTLKKKSLESLASTVKHSN